MGGCRLKLQWTWRKVLMVLRRRHMQRQPLWLRPWRRQRRRRRRRRLAEILQRLPSLAVVAGLDRVELRERGVVPVVVHGRRHEQATGPRRARP